MAIDYTTPVGRVRLNITDTDEAAPLFTDAQLQAWLDDRDGSINWASYRALLTIATSELLISKKIKTQDLTTDGPAVAASLLKLAQVYRAEAEAEGGTVDFVGYISGQRAPGLEAEEGRCYGPTA